MQSRLKRWPIGPMLKKRLEHRHRRRRVACIVVNMKNSKYIHIQNIKAQYNFQKTYISKLYVLCVLWIFVICLGCWFPPPIPGVNVQVPSSGTKYRKKQLLSDCLRFLELLVLNGPPTPHPHPRRQSMFPSGGKKCIFYLCEKRNIY